MTKTEKLLKKMKSRKTGMSHKEVVQYLLDLTHGKGVCDASGYSNYWSRNLYGSVTNKGVYERFCKKDRTTGRYHVVKTISAPFTTARRTRSQSNQSYNW